MELALVCLACWWVSMGLSAMSYAWHQVQIRRCERDEECSRIESAVFDKKIGFSK